MATVVVPPLMRDLTGGLAEVAVAGETVRDLVDSLEQRYPGMRDRLTDDGELKSNLAVSVDGVVSQRGLSQPVTGASIVHVLSAIFGG